MNITNASQIAYANSAVYIRIDLQNEFPTYLPPEKNTRVRLQLMTFDIDDLGNETNVNTYILDNARVSKDDKQVTFEIDDRLKNDLIRKKSFNNVDFPVLLYNNLSLPYTKGLCLFYRYSYYAYDETTSATAVNVTNRVATLGFRLDNEAPAFYGSYVGDTGGFNVANTPIKKYAEFIPFYAKQSFNFGNNRTTNNFITTEQVTPAKTQCVKEPLLLIFINRQGLFEYITTTGKVVISNEIKRNDSNKVFRDNGMINPQSTHFKNTSIDEVFRTYTVNTGILDPSMNGLIEELLYSPKVYLVRFYGDRFTAAQQGITVDSTIVTADNTTITSDSDTVTVGDIGFYSTFLQVPVVCIDTDFTQKNLINDKREVSYTLKFRETASKIKKQ